MPILRSTAEAPCSLRRRLTTYALSSSESHLTSSGKSGMTKKKAALTTQVRIPSRMKICKILSVIILVYVESRITHPSPSFVSCNTVHLSDSCCEQTSKGAGESCARKEETVSPLCFCSQVPGTKQVKATWEHSRLEYT